jgi:hypothetical protein
MSPLFGKSDEKVAQEEAARGAAERFQTLPATGLAVEIMPAFGPEGAKPSAGRGINIIQVLAWVMSPYPRGTKYMKELDTPVREAIQLLENAGLVLRRTHGGAGAWLTATRLGETALAERDVARYLQDPARP